ncbi:MAG: GGDEF domain-containing protein [Armatimonadetes bacterium]|nr:GGDEF domain-containing protein [Armatimonadota bacterium]
MNKERLIEAISIQASVILSFALSAQQSRGLLDEYASDNQKLSVQASLDGLTGLLNHKTLQQKLSDLCKQDARVNSHKFCLLMIDVDHFKRYNDTYGHQEGDEVLRMVAEVITSKIRQSDFATRYGGEEFAVVIRASKDEALILAERIRQAVASTKLRLGSIAISTGIAEYPADGNSPAEVIEKADKALYKAKASGRNCVLASEQTEINEEPRAA